jgi:glutathione peroxidase
MLKKLTAISLLCFSAFTSAEDCPEWLNVDVKKLRSQDTVNLCELKKDKVLLVVNTASECGFTPQFKGLEALYQKYKDQGLEIVGFPSDSFRQELDNEEDTAKICYVNYGVTFTMLSTTPVRGDEANPVFAHLGEELGSPKWNFYKYLIGRDGKPLERFSSKTEPMDDKLISTLEQALK